MGARAHSALPRWSLWAQIRQADGAEAMAGRAVAFEIDRRVAGGVCGAPRAGREEDEGWWRWDPFAASSLHTHGLVEQHEMFGGNGR